MRLLLWPRCPLHRHPMEMKSILDDAHRQVVFVAEVGAAWENRRDVDADQSESGHPPRRQSSVAPPRRPARVTPSKFESGHSSSGASGSPPRLCGFVEGSIHPHAVGCETNPVGYVEGWWVDPDHRQTGVGRKLLAALEDWARRHGCREMASDCLADNHLSRAAHCATGYHETGTLIHFAKRIQP